MKALRQEKIGSVIDLLASLQVKEFKLRSPHLICFSDKAARAADVHRIPARVGPRRLLHLHPALPVPPAHDHAHLRLLPGMNGSDKFVTRKVELNWALGLVLVKISL